MAKRLEQSLWLAMVLIYAVILVNAVLFKNVSVLDLFHEDRLFGRSLNIVPFREIFRYISAGVSGISLKILLSNILGNIALFIPAGYFLYIFFDQMGIIRCTLLLAFLSAGFEALQYVFGLGGSDVDDVILNVLGGLVGAGFYHIVKGVFGQHRCKRISLWLCLVAGGFAIVFAYLQYPQYMPFYKPQEKAVIIVGEEYFIDFWQGNVRGSCIGYDGNIITLENTGMDVVEMPGIYTDPILYIKIEKDTKLSEMKMDDGGKSHIVWTFSPFDEEGLYMFNDDVFNGMSLHVREENGQLVAEELCVYFPAEEE